MIAILKDIEMKGKSIFITLESSSKELDSAVKLIGKKIEIEISKYYEKRTLNANGYCWKLITLIAEKVGSSKEEIYLEMLKAYGQSDTISILEEVQIEDYFKYYSFIGKSVLNNKNFNHYRVYKGTSQYNKKEMQIFINGIVEDCKTLEIETKTPQELSILIESWNNKC